MVGWKPNTQLNLAAKRLLLRKGKQTGGEVRPGPRVWPDASFPW